MSFHKGLMSEDAAFMLGGGLQSIGGYLSTGQPPQNNQYLTHVLKMRQEEKKQKQFQDFLAGMQSPGAGAGSNLAGMPQLAGPGGARGGGGGGIGMSPQDQQMAMMAFGIDPKLGFKYTADRMAAPSERKTYDDIYGAQRYRDTGKLLAGETARKDPKSFEDKMRFDKDLGQFYQLGPDMKRHYQKTPEGIEIFKTQDGFTFRMGPGVGGGKSLTAPSGLTKSSTGQLQKAVIDSTNLLDKLDYITALYEPEFSHMEGDVKGFVQGIEAYISPEAEAQFLQRRNVWRKQHGQTALAYRKSVTGVAGGEREMRDIMKSFPNVDDPSQVYLPAMEAQKAITRKLRARSVQALKQGITPKYDNTQCQMIAGGKVCEPIGAWKDFLELNPLDSFPSADERGNSLQAQGYTDAQVLQILEEEGYY